MSLLQDLQALRSAAVDNQLFESKRIIDVERTRLIQKLKSAPLLPVPIWEKENAEWAKSEGLTVVYSGDIIPQWKVSIPEDFSDE
jgi:hypothetical protein